MKIHLLNGADNRYRAVLHTSVPAGSNAVGVTWKQALLGAGISGKTILATGTGAGQVDATEAAQIAAGDMIEIEFTFVDNPSLAAAARLALLNLYADRALAEFNARNAAALNLYGYTVA